MDYQIAVMGLVHATSLEPGRKTVLHSRTSPDSLPRAARPEVLYRCIGTCVHWAPFLPHDQLLTPSQAGAAYSKNAF